MNEQHFFRIIKLIADSCFDGHFTIMKFTTNWRVSFGYQPDSRDAIEGMACGNTLINAFVKAIEKADFSDSKETDAPQNAKEAVEYIA